MICREMAEEARAWDTRQLDPKTWEDAPEAVPRSSELVPHIGDWFISKTWGVVQFEDYVTIDEPILSVMIYSRLHRLLLGKEEIVELVSMTTYG